MKKVLPEQQTIIEAERDFSFRSFRKMYLKLLPEDRAKVQFVLQMTADQMQHILHKTKKKRFEKTNR